jgi:hypothetical protein
MDLFAVGHWLLLFVAVNRIIFSAYTYGDILLYAKVFMTHLPALAGFLNDNGVKRVAVGSVIHHIPDITVSLCSGYFHHLFKLKCYHV